MIRILSTQLLAHAGETVRLAGWVHRRRQLKSVSFLVLRDRAGLVQAVAEPGALDGVTEETVVRVTGTAVANPVAPGGAEVVDPTIEVLGDVAEPPPFDLYRPELRAGLPALLDHAPVALRHPGVRLAHEVAAAVAAGFRGALDRLGFVEVHTPKIVASATESGANVFAIDYFGRPAYLAQSPQFYKQMLVGVFERVYEVGPVFRAEPHATGRHLAQYTSLDAEFGFIADHRDVMAVLREAVAGMVAAARPHLRAERPALPHLRAERPALPHLRAERPALPRSPADRFALPEVPQEIPELHFRDALELLGAPADEPDLAPAHERALGEWARREHGTEFLFVTGYPMVKRPFYTYPEPGGRYSKSFDLLFRGMEICTGGQRLHRYGDYLHALAERGESPAGYGSYLDTFRHGMPPHGGFAIGLERFVARLIGAANVRQTTLFPRDRDRLTP